MRSAGQLVLIKNSTKDDQLSVVISSNASGTYKPDLLSADLLASKLAFEYRVPRGNITVTEGEPLGTQTIEILAKANGMEKSLIKSMIEPIKSEARSLLENPYSAFEEPKLSPPLKNNCLTSLSRIPSSLNFEFLKLVGMCR